jgi:hypothetical protein
MDILRPMVSLFPHSFLIPGARPLNRLIQKVILEPLAMELISGGVGPNEEVKIRVEGGLLVVKRNHDVPDVPPPAQGFEQEDLD